MSNPGHVFIRRLVAGLAAIIGFSSPAQTVGAGKLPGHLGTLRNDKTYIWMEAEDGLNAENDKAFVPVDDEAAYNGKYISKPDGTAAYALTIPKAGRYLFHARAYASSGNDDSFEVKLVAEGGNVVFAGAWNFINAGRRNQWAWGAMTGGRTKPEVLNPSLPAGNYTLSFYARDADEAKLDRLVVTDDATFEPTSGRKKDDGVYLEYEAEAGNVSAPFIRTKDSQASGGQYVWVKKAGTVYDFTLRQGGKYRLWAYAYGQDGKGDSVFLSINGGKRDTWPFLKGKWGWVAYGAGDKATGIELNTGRNAIHIIQRERGAGVDALLITDDLDFVPVKK